MSKWFVAFGLLMELAALVLGLTYIALVMPLYLVGELQTVAVCILFGGLGGCVYCLRGVYLNACVNKCWGNDWLPWYVIRPFISLVLGGISYLLIKSGLLLLGSSIEPGGSQPGLWTLAFLAGLNVDRFLAKIEGIGHTAWGIEPSRQSKPEP